MFFKKIIGQVFIMLILNIVLYLIFAFFAEKYSPIYATYRADDMPVIGILQSDYRHLWQAFLWPMFALILGSIYGYSIRHQQQKVKWFFVTLIFGLICMTSVGIFLEKYFPNGSMGFLQFSTGFDGKINLTFLSVVLWPITYFLSLALMCFLPKETKEKQKGSRNIRVRHAL